MVSGVRRAGVPTGEPRCWARHSGTFLALGTFSLVLWFLWVSESSIPHPHPSRHCPSCPPQNSHLTSAQPTLLPGLRESAAPASPASHVLLPKATPRQSGLQQPQGAVSHNTLGRRTQQGNSVLSWGSTETAAPRWPSLRLLCPQPLILADKRMGGDTASLLRAHP